MMLLYVSIANYNCYSSTLLPVSCIELNSSGHPDSLKHYCAILKQIIQCCSLSSSDLLSRIQDLENI